MSPARERRGHGLPLLPAPLREGILASLAPRRELRYLGVVVTHVNRAKLLELYGRKPVILAPLEDVSDVVFRRVCRSLGAEITLTEFVNVEGLLRGCKNARRKIHLADDDVLTAIQIYGSDPERLAEAARFAESA